MRPCHLGETNPAPRVQGGDRGLQSVVRKGGDGGSRVLVIDDEGNHARVMAIGLRLEGFDVETSPDAASALERLAAERFDLAIVDLMMPGTNGIQLARLIRQRHPGTRVVLTSAYHLSERQLLNADCGAVGFVPKPFEVSDLARFLRSKCTDAASSALGGVLA